MSDRDANSLGDKEFEQAEHRAPDNSKVERHWTSDELFGADERVILITHGEDVYRLRKTRNGKLILHK